MGLRLFNLESIYWQKGNLCLLVGELGEGEPDGYIGTPMVLREGCEVFRVAFPECGEFRCVGEPYFQLKGHNRRINEFIVEKTNSDYASSACPFGLGPPEGKARHFIVLCELIVVEILSASDPCIETARFDSDQWNLWRKNEPGV